MTGATDVETFLAPLAAIARKRRHLEGLVFWGGADGWPDSPSEALEAEEIAFYAEGLLIDGFGMHWALVADASGEADHLRLSFWQDGPPPPAPPPGWTVLEQGKRPPAPP
ncbi:hypothetical protein [Tabrizicola flagellatus]|uniref:hypothetical protein n=1 Tax=Tabrizicola flagellatus TaxID=2593021 RepID=UPI0011F2C2D4|nr:hypothetical protein [Tabrizicola flagellatus]